MKRILLLLFIGCGFLTKAQVYNNNWIDYSKTYHKFKVGSNGVYRISQTVLNTLGIGNAPAQEFQLWRQGKEIPLYTSVASGPLGAGGYIEFWGEMNDGKPEKNFYGDTTHQLNDHWSLQTDTSSYFLTVNPSGPNKRLVNTVNDVAANVLSPEPYFMHTLGNYFRMMINPGFAVLVGDAYVYSSAYEKGEGWSSTNIVSERPAGPSVTYVPPVTYNTTHLNLHVYNGGPIPTFRINASGNAINPRSFRVKINNSTVANPTMDYFDHIRYEGQFPIATIASDAATIDIINESSASLDRMAVAQYEIVYPRQFNFDNLKNFVFELPANAIGNYVEITNFNYGTIAPVLYDVTNGKRYVADITNPAIIKIALQPSSVDRKLILVSQDATNINAVTTLQTRNFINYGLATNQGDYLIISNSILYNGPNGSNPVEDYRVYRNSPAGGGFNAKVYDIDQLVDQFGFGIKKHSASVKNFVQYAYNTYSTQPKFILLLGKGVNYAQYRGYENWPDSTIQSDLEKLNLVPTYGFPASDNLISCFDGDNIPKIPTGRLSVINGDEVALYLRKVKDYEMAQASSSPYIEDKAWMKNVVHVVGADGGALQGILGQMMYNYSQIVADTLFGAHVSTFSKTSSEAVQQLNSERLRNLFEDGISLILYFGHSSATTLEFNLDNPMNYNNQGKYPIFVTLGCNAGNLYNFNQNRFLTTETISEKFVLAPERGSIAFIASTSLGIVQYLDILNTCNYRALSDTKYGKSLGEILQEGIRTTFDITSQYDFYARVHCEQISVNGDPALRYNAHPKPDYVIEPQLVKITPTFISVAEDSFKIDAKMLNIGRAIDKTIVIKVERTYPNNTTEVIRRDTVPGIRYIDSILVMVPVVANRDKGLNKINITVDADYEVDELYETNNSLITEVFIYEDEARPVFPYNLSIINTQGINLVASTADAFAPSKSYTMELDTTEFFNSTFKITRTLTSAGGVLEFTPGINFTDSTVYYWRVAHIPATGDPKWNVSSFIYLPASDPGFNQSHFYQHTKSSNARMTLDSASREWNFDSVTNNLFIRNAIFPTGATQQADFTVSVNDQAFIGGGCNYNELIINAFDPRTFKPLRNIYTPPTGPGLYGSLPSFCSNRKEYNFEYLYSDSASRRLAWNFLKNIVPNGAYVVIRSNVLPSDPGNVYPSTWQAEDVPVYGAGNTLYDLLFSQGFTTIDSFNRPRTWIFVYKKNDQTNFTPQAVFTQGNFDKITLSVNCETPDSLGFITSPLFGPAKEWKQLHWRGGSQDGLPGDNPTVDVYGSDQDGNGTLIFSGLDQSMQDFDISGINANLYPYVRLRMRNVDSINYTPYQKRYWRVTYTPVPEGAIAPNIFFQMSDTVDVGQPFDFKVAFKNISQVPFDSLKIKMVVTGSDNVPVHIPIPRKRPLPSNDTVIISTTIDTRNFPGLNNLYVNVNPDFDQPEQYLFNNFAFKNFYTRPDSLNPLMDVTFDGIHILNKDIVSPKPHILIKLKDEAKWMALTDTSLLTLNVRFPDGSLHRYYFSNIDTLQFTPAGPAPVTDNLATIDFTPYFTQDGEYELIVTGKDLSGNQAGMIEYRVSFQVFNKPMISNMLNYPNPFTTSTAFVFTITGVEVPQNIKIEIMTITGKIVREITKDELGPLHIGRNITEFKWNGTDQYGQKLANGIYLYRVVTNLNGKSLDKFKALDDNTDKYFNKGYGKMYLMR